MMARMQGSLNNMNLGYFTQPFHPITKVLSQSLHEDHEAAVIADRNGYTEAIFGEHATDAYETITSSLTFISSLCFNTKNIKLGTGTINIPNTHPALVASTVSMLDHMLKGRLLLGVSMGALPTDWEIYGSLDLNKEAMFEEAMFQILELWKTKAPYNLKGSFWDISTEKTMNMELGLGNIMKPYQKPHPEILCTALSPNSIGLKKAGQKGWSPVSSNFIQPKHVSSHWFQYAEGSRIANIKADKEKWRVAKMIFVNEDHKKALEYGKGLDGPYAKCINQIIKKLKVANKISFLKENENQKDEEITLEYCIDKLVIAGDPASVKDQLYDFVNKTGEFGTLLYVGVDWLNRSLAKKSMELMANKVVNEMNF